MNFIFINGKIETLSFFSTALATELEKMGHTTYTHEFYDNAATLGSHISDDTYLITFNCIGISGEDEYMTVNGRSIWHNYNIHIVNILVDHPLYYHDQLTHADDYASGYDNLTVVCIDRYHLQYLNTYYPEIHHSFFMTLAGSAPENIPAYSDRKYDIIFTGNFTPCSHFDKYIERAGKEYSSFYHGIIDELLSSPGQPIEKVCIRHILNDIPDASPSDIRQVMNNMIFIDLYVRFYMRERVIRAICDAGFNLHIIGKGFEAITLADGSHPESTALMPTEYCLNETALSKISVNVMPWFRDGSHDRILSSMLCGSVTFSDPSLWLDNNFTGREMCFYDLNNMSELTSHIAGILDDTSAAMEIAAGGRKKALALHTWKARAAELLEHLKDN